MIERINIISSLKIYTHPSISPIISDVIQVFCRFHSSYIGVVVKKMVYSINYAIYFIHILSLNLKIESVSDDCPIGTELNFVSICIELFDSSKTVYSFYHLVCENLVFFVHYSDQSAGGDIHMASTEEVLAENIWFVV